MQLLRLEKPFSSWARWTRRETRQGQDSLSSSAEVAQKIARKIDFKARISWRGYEYTSEKNQKVFRLILLFLINVTEGYCIQGSPSWLDKCPVCKSGNLSAVSKKKFLGLAKDESIECNSCQAKFRQEGTKYRLSYVTDPSNLIWQEYSNGPLEEREWKNIAEGGLSDDKQRDADMETWLTVVKNGNVPRLSSELH